MAHAFVSLLCIVAVALLAPLLSWGVPRRMLPETVLLILGGVIIGPDVLGIAHIGRDIGFLRELGIAFLFLMAGYEIDVNELRGSGGRHAIVAWGGSLVLAFATVALVGVTGGVFSANGIAIAIAMTSTAIGTILPILRERGLLPTAVGAAILNHGAVGEVGPVILMALLLGTRSTWQEMLILLAFLGIALWIVLFTERVKRWGRKLVDAIRLGGSTTAQTTVRVTVLLLVGLCTVAEVFDLDVVLGAFAAGFILRYALPDGNREFEEKLDGLAYGFFVPIFFVTSGMGITLEMSASALISLGAFLILLVLTRGLPVWLAARLERRRDGSRSYSMRQSLQIAVYSTTALPIIVAVTQVATNAGAMSDSFASTLVLAGALSVLVMPTLGLLLSNETDHAPAVEALGVVQGPVDAAGRGADDHAAASGRLDEGPGELLHSEPRRPAGLDEAPSPASPAQAREGSTPPPTHRSEARGRRGRGRGARTGDAWSPASASSAAQPVRRGHDAAFHHHGLSEAEARRLAERLAQIDEERALWREQMRRQMHLDREESQQRRAVLRAQAREHRREERAEMKALREQAARARREERARAKADQEARARAEREVRAGAGEKAGGRLRRMASRRSARRGRR